MTNITKEQAVLVGKLAEVTPAKVVLINDGSRDLSPLNFGGSMKILHRYSSSVLMEVKGTLVNANLRDADLHNADLSDADLSGADLYNANLRDADLSGADLHRSGSGESKMS